MNDARTASPLSPKTASERAARVVKEVGRVLTGKEEAITLAVTALVARGHLLVEDVPGVGKTTLARALAKVVGVPFTRLQCTSDLLPADVLGGSVYLPQPGGGIIVIVYSRPKNIINGCHQRSFKRNRPVIHLFCYKDGL